LLPTPPRDGTLIRFLPLVASHSSFSGENINQPEITADFYSIRSYPADELIKLPHNNDPPMRGWSHKSQGEKWRISDATASTMTGGSPWANISKRTT
jgi:hypothetical protein